MGYQLEVLSAASASIKRMDETTSVRVLLKLKWLSENLDAIKPKRLKGEYSEFFKLRLGDYRIFYTVDRDENRIFVHRVAHRSIAYKQP
ncbi:MAG: type II toxin-antitoxin system RelE/ParE family toxin [Dehalococcoidales bacterium]|nr:type II toxin-antitoxin system RelE/ParE family toxin [Dehalococcoidales bacterium]